MSLGLIFGSKRKRKPVGKTVRKVLLKYQDGKCWMCKRSFKEMSVRPVLHHKNLNPNDNRISNLVLICPNCHDKIHQKIKKVRKKVIGPLGLPEYHVVKIKKPVKRKTKKKKKKKPIGLFDIKPQKLPRLF